jgi:hypothetical protein
VIEPHVEHEILIENEVVVVVERHVENEVEVVVIVQGDCLRYGRRVSVTLWQGEGVSSFYVPTSIRSISAALGAYRPFMAASCALRSFSNIVLAPSAIAQ